MSRRTLLVVAALIATGVPSVVAPVAAQATGGGVEPIARTMVTQTQGPPGSWASPNNLIPWGLDRIDSRGPGPSGAYGENRLDGAYTHSSDGTGVKVYVLDSGVNASHSDFGARVVDGWSYRSHLASLNSYKQNRAANDADPNVGIAECPRNWPESNPQYEREFDPAVFDAPASVDTADKGTTDNDGHGTHVAGIVAGATTGVAKNATIVPVRALDSCGVGTQTMILNALAWIKADHQNGEKAVVNMSIGFEDTATDVDTSIRSLIAEGMLVVAAAGNDAATSCGTTPAGTAGTFSVGSSDSSDAESYFSNYGDCVDISAPGRSILSSWPYLKPIGGSATVNGWWVQSGTSMAAPHVTGALARWLQGQSTVPVSSSVSEDAWTWSKTNSTCDAVAPYSQSRSMQTPNRLLAVGASVKKPCGPGEWQITPGVQAGTVEFTASPTGNGAAVTAYTVTLSPGSHTCTVDPSTATEPYSCAFSGLERATTYQLSLTATNSAGTGPARTDQFTTPDVPPAVTGLTAAPGDHQATFAWSGNVVGATYTVALVPDDGTCTSTGTGCTVTGLVNGRTYTATVTGTNPNGTGLASGAVQVVPDGAPEVPAIKLSAANRSVTISWFAVPNVAEVTYVVTATPGGRSCTTTTTSCTVTGLSNGVEYSFAISLRTGTGKVAASSTGTAARPAFTVKKTVVKKGSRTLLGSIVSPVSKGRRTWSVKGGCSLAAGRLVAPKRKVTCRLTLRTARTSSFPAASTTVKVAVK